MALTEAQKKANNKYIKANIREFKLRFNKSTEPGIITWLEAQNNIQGYVRELILADMAHKQISADTSKGVIEEDT